VRVQRRAQGFGHAGRIPRPVSLRDDLCLPNIAACLSCAHGSMAHASSAQLRAPHRSIGRGSLDNTSVCTFCKLPLS
jgi:hypothetical protein